MQASHKHSAACAFANEFSLKCVLKTELNNHSTVLYFCHQKKSDSASLCQSVSVFGWKEFGLNFVLHRVEIPKSWHDFYSVLSVFAFCWFYRFHISELLFCLVFVFHTESKADVNRFLDWSLTHSTFNENSSQFIDPYILYYASKVSDNKPVSYCSQSAYCLICIATSKNYLSLVITSIAFTTVLGDTQASTESKHLYYHAIL